MTELTGWRRIIGHQGTFLADLELWPPERAGKVRHLQSGYGAIWSFGRSTGQDVVESGPIDLVGARSIGPGQTGQVLIHPMVPEVWQGVDRGALLTLMSRGSRMRAIGQALVVERRGVPASAPLNPLSFDERPGRARLRAVTPAPAEKRPAAAPPVVTVAAAALPLLSSHWGPATDLHAGAPASRAAEIQLAARLPELGLDRTAETRVTVHGAELPALAAVAYFSSVDPDGIPSGERHEVDLDWPAMLAEVDHTHDGWVFAIPAVRAARAVVITLTFTGSPPGTSQRSASWGFRIR